MPDFDKESELRLRTCDEDLQSVIRLAIEVVDFSILEGYRSPTRQKELYAQGRTKPGQIVTNVDGTKIKGKHNHYPSKAVDVLPNPFTDWRDIIAFAYIAGHIKMSAKILGVKIEWGGNWKKLKDYTHFELL